MILTRRYELDIIPGGLPLLIRAYYKDTSSTLVFSLFTGKGKLAVPAGTTAALRCKEGSASATFALTNGIPTVTVDLTIDFTGTVGIIPCEIVLTNSEYTLVTATLYLDVR